MRNTHDLTPGGLARDELMTRVFEPLNTPMIAAPHKTLFPKTQPGPDPPQPSDSGEGPVIVRSSDYKPRAAKQKLRPTVDEFHPCQRPQYPQESYQQHDFQQNPQLYYTQQGFQQIPPVYYTQQVCQQNWPVSHSTMDAWSCTPYRQPAPRDVSGPNGHLRAPRRQSPLQSQVQVQAPPVQTAPISRPSSAPAPGTTCRARDGPALSEEEYQYRLINKRCFYCKASDHFVCDCPLDHRKQKRKQEEASKGAYLGFGLPVENSVAEQQQQQRRQGPEQEPHEENEEKEGEAVVMEKGEGEVNGEEPQNDEKARENGEEKDEATEDSTGGTSVLERLVDATPQPLLITPRRRANSAPPTISCDCDFQLKYWAECPVANTRRRNSMHCSHWVSASDTKKCDWCIRKCDNCIAYLKANPGSEQEASDEIQDGGSEDA